MARRLQGYIKHDGTMAPIGISNSKSEGRHEIVDVLPTPANAEENTIYFVRDTSQEDTDANYYTKTQIDSLIESKVGIPIGFERFVANPHIEAGWLPLLGGTYAKSVYRDLWDWVSKQTGYLIYEDEWQSKSRRNEGNVPFYATPRPTKVTTGLSDLPFVIYYSEQNRCYNLVLSNINTKANSSITLDPRYYTANNVGVSCSLANAITMENNVCKFVKDVTDVTLTITFHYTITNKESSAYYILEQGMTGKEHLDAASGGAVGVNLSAIFTQMSAEFVTTIESDLFRVPSLKCWVKAGETIEEVGSYLEAGLPNIKGQTVYTGASSGGETPVNSGALRTQLSGATKTSTTAGGSGDVTISFDASNSNLIYGTSETVQPKSIVGMWQVRAKGATTNPGNVDIETIASNIETTFSDTTTDLIDKNNKLEERVTNALNTTTTKLNNDMELRVKRADLVNLIYPVGSIYMSVNNVSPSVFLGGEWEALANGRTLIAANEEYPAGTTGGEASHTLTVDEMPSHAHTRGTMNITGGGLWNDSSTYKDFGTRLTGAFYARGTNKWGNGSTVDEDNSTVEFDASRSWTGETSYVGSGAAHNVMQPYMAVYMWRRTA